MYRSYPATARIHTQTALPLCRIHKSGFTHKGGKLTPLKLISTSGLSTSDRRGGQAVARYDQRVLVNKWVECVRPWRHFVI